MALLNADCTQVICSFLYMREYIPLQLVNSVFYRGVKQHCALQNSFYMTKHLKFLIETAGKDREICLSKLRQGVFYERASKLCISKQLKNLITSLFVNAQNIYFSDVELSMDFITLMFCDVKRKKKQSQSTTDEELSFKNQSVFDLVNKLTFVGCRFNAGVMEWISKKFRALESLCVSNCTFDNYPSRTSFPIAELYYFVNERKCSCYDSLRFIWLDSLFLNASICINLSKASETEKVYLNQFLDMSENSIKQYEDYSNASPRDFEDLKAFESLIPDHIKLSDCTFFFMSERLEKCLNMFGIFHEAYVDLCQCFGLVKGHGFTDVMTYEEPKVANIEYVLNMGLHLFDVEIPPQLMAVIIVFHYDNSDMLHLLKSFDITSPLLDMDSYDMNHLVYLTQVAGNVIALAKHFNVLTNGFKAFFTEFFVTRNLAMADVFVNSCSFWYNFNHGSIPHGIQEVIDFVCESKKLSSSAAHTVNSWKQRTTILNASTCAEDEQDVNPALKKRKQE
ncbi:hypothetical protein C9374_003793 [Naegleria lovaniensis]|uniref:Uncharacterized protein n=1 Tax=Naegleria lovaniensis TaxID=51637 RepID=A0AA88KSX6_NAELO|nr:uncharacterized protein C9374_003793 [Naegleria lovaniensis]KAG2394029.1 hypothetical protein C9374_003793 [Naegleria lovaniensis]